MSEIKRVPIQTLELPNSLSNSTKKEKKEKGKQLAPSFRFELSLDEKNEKGYSEFNYMSLLEKKKAKEPKNIGENAVNGLDPLDDNDDAKLKEIARKFEAKYRTTQPTGKRKKKYDEDYVDLGAGYDENDPFIDNTDAYDEVVPEGVHTAYGGFYINSGPLEFSVKETNQSESSEDDEEDSPDSKRRERDLGSSEDGDAEEALSGPISKKLKLDDNCEKKSSYDNVTKRRKKHHDHSHSDNSIRQKNESMEVDSSFVENQEEKKRLQCDTSRSKEKKLAKKHITNGTEDKKIESKKCSGKDNNIDDAIESVVNDGKLDDESSRDTIDSGKSRCAAGTSSECEDVEKIDIRLPDHLSEDIKDIIVKLKKHAENNKEGKIKFFGTSVNDTLLSLEKKLRGTESSTIRSQVYGHLAHFLSCSKITLVNRARKLCLQDAETRVEEPVQRLKAIIDRIVLSQKDEENRKIVDEKGIDIPLSDGYSDDSNKKSQKDGKNPRKRFSWTNEAKKLVCEIANVWRQYYKIRKPRKESIESFMESMMKNKILPLWPKDWMRLEVLMAIANSDSTIKRKQKKPRDTSVPNELSSVITNNCSVKLETTTINQKLSPETAKSPTRYDQALIENSVNNTSITQNSKAPTTEIIIEKKSINTKYKEKVKENSTLSNQPVSNSGTSGAKITLVPTVQLMAQKPLKNHTDKFDPIDLTSNSLSITPVNDYQRMNKMVDEVKKDIVSITPYESSSGMTVINDGPHSLFRPDVIFSSHMANQLSGSKPLQSLKQRILLQESVSGKAEKRTDDRERDVYLFDQKIRKRDRWIKDKSFDPEKKRKDHKMAESNQQPSSRVGVLNVMLSPSTLSKEEQEKRQIEETMAATNYLSQIINDDAPRLNIEKRKEMSDEGISNIVQPTEQEKDVQMVMRSLKELQELQEMKCSPNHSPLQKPIIGYGIGFPDEFQRLYHKKDDKIKTKDDSHSSFQF